MQQSLTARVVKFTLEVMAPVIVAVDWVLRKTYKVFFGRMELRMSREEEEKLGHEILTKLSFLFEEYGGRLCPYESPFKALKHPRPFDFAFVMVSLDDLSLVFFRGRGDISVQIAPKHSPSALEDLALVLNLIDERFEQRYFRSFDEVAVALEPRIKLLREAISPEKYPELQKGLANAHAYDRAVIRQWQTEISRRLFPEK